MKKVYFLFCALLAGVSLTAQTVPGGDMENWRTSTAGGGLRQRRSTIQAPNPWFGAGFYSCCTRPGPKPGEPDC